MKQFYTEEMIEFLKFEFANTKLNCKKFSKYASITYNFNQLFGTNQTQKAIEIYCAKLGLKNYTRKKRKEVTIRTKTKNL